MARRLVPVYRDREWAICEECRCAFLNNEIGEDCDCPECGSDKLIFTVEMDNTAHHDQEMVLIASYEITKALVNGERLWFIESSIVGEPKITDATNMSYKDVLYYIDQVKTGKAICVRNWNE